MNSRVCFHLDNLSPVLITINKDLLLAPRRSILNERSKWLNNNIRLLWFHLEEEEEEEERELLL